MRSVEEMQEMNRSATIDEYVKAYLDGNFTLAKRIRTANPDIWPEVDDDSAS